MSESDKTEKIEFADVHLMKKFQGFSKWFDNTLFNA